MASSEQNLFWHHLLNVNKTKSEIVSIIMQIIKVEINMAK